MFYKKFSVFCFAALLAMQAAVCSATVPQDADNDAKPKVLNQRVLEVRRGCCCEVYGVLATIKKIVERRQRRATEADGVLKVRRGCCCEVYDVFATILQGGKNHDSPIPLHQPRLFHRRKK